MKLTLEVLEDWDKVFLFDITVRLIHHFVLTLNFSFLSSYSHHIPSVCYYDIGCMLFIEPSFNNNSAKINLLKNCSMNTFSRPSKINNIIFLLKIFLNFVVCIFSTSRFNFTSSNVGKKEKHLLQWLTNRTPITEGDIFGIQNIPKRKSFSRKK